MKTFPFLFILFSLLVQPTAQAAMVIDGDPDEVISVKASLSDPNIITINGGSIESVWAAEDKVMLQANEQSGQAVFRPTSKSPFTLFVQSAAGNTYTLTVVPVERLIGQNFVIKEHDSFADQHMGHTASIVAYKKEVKRILKQIEQLRQRKRLNGFRVKSINKRVSLWQETSILHALSWNRDDMQIDRFVVTNITDAPLSLDERAFKHISPSVRAVSLRKHNLEPAESTVLYVFRSAQR